MWPTLTLQLRDLVWALGSLSRPTIIGLLGVVTYGLVEFGK